MKKIPLLFTLLTTMLSVSAQTDYTSKITNPSFENDWVGWNHKGMGIQGNNVFSIKQGNNYVEKWTGKGGAVGSGSVSQTISGLEPGNYELTAAAQNIQEDTPTAQQTGAWIFAGDKKTTVTVRNTYTVKFTYISGSIDIGFEAVDASGNWISVDNFQLKLVGKELTAELQAAITHAEATLGDGTGQQAAQLNIAITNAKAVLDNTSATGDDQANAIVALLEAEDIFLRANASEINPLDLTSSIINPSFEMGDFTGWSNTNMSTQGNNVFSIKKGNIYVEKWTGKGGAVGDARLSQTLKGMQPGRYRLKAAAQNIQEDSPRTAQAGAWIFANTHREAVTIRQEYTLTFVLVSDELELGFVAEGATGNWISVDNFRLEYIGDDFSAIKTEFNDLIAKAEQLATERMNTTTLQKLQTAINNAKPLLSQSNADGWGQAARQLEAAYQEALTSQAAFAKLKSAIDAAQAEINASSAANKTEYQAAIDAATAVYNATATTNAQALAAIETLTQAAFAFKVANGFGTVPNVKTDPRFIRGCTWAFGRSTVSGSNIIERGFCWSENPDPKVTDFRSTEILNQAGEIFWMRDLKPATMYYMRAYAITKDYAVGYGDVIKFCTVPKGQVGHWYNNGGDEATNDRINYAINTAMDYYWNNLTSIHGFGISVSYSPGTPTADCSYGGSMRVGASSSYQQPGTIMHEALHGIGVGTHGNWWSGDYRPNGIWAGDRVTEALHFWDNNTTTVLAGDDMHMWPYGCNGAHEDTHNDQLYCMMGILAQALNEDGLPGSGAIGYALPYYSFNHEEDVKYYIKNEDPNRGFSTSFLVENASHQLVWQAMSAEEAAANDAAAWYITFTPSNQYYQLKNAKSGYYMTYSSNFITAKHTNPTSADNIHLMRGRVDVSVANGSIKHRGYYFIHPESSGNPPTLNANANGKTASTGFSISNSATTQRWLILTAEQAQQMETGNFDAAKKELNDLIAQLQKLAETPHTEDADGTDATFSSTLSTIQTQGAASTSTSEIASLLTQAQQAGMTFLANVSASDITQPFDLTFMLQNPNFDTSGSEGWTTNNQPNYREQESEFYETTFDFYQILEKMPKGIYQLHANAFQRPGEITAVDNAYTNGTSRVTTQLYIGSTRAAVKHICDDSQPRALYSGNDKKLTNGNYVPNTMEGAARYFAKGLYDSSVTHEQKNANANLRVGIRCTSAPSYYWSIFDNFRLYYFGQNRTLVGIDEVLTEPTEKTEPIVVYDLQGRKLKNSNTQELENLPKGIYIINGKKIMVK